MTDKLLIEQLVAALVITAEAEHSRLNGSPLSEQEDVMAREIRIKAIAAAKRHGYVTV